MPVDPSTPLKLADGTMVFPDGRVVKPSEVGVADTVSEVIVPTASEAQAIVLKTRRTTSDLPDVPKTMNAVGVVLMYTLFGLTDAEISMTVPLPFEQVTRIKALPAYTMMHDALVETMATALKDDARDLFAAHTKTAVSTITDLMAKGKQEVRLGAAKDILDRAGLRPKDNDASIMKSEHVLRIEVVRKDERRDTVTIDMEDTL